MCVFVWSALSTGNRTTHTHIHTQHLFNFVKHSQTRSLTHTNTTNENNKTKQYTLPSQTHPINGSPSAWTKSSTERRQWLILMSEIISDNEYSLYQQSLSTRITDEKKNQTNGIRISCDAVMVVDKGNGFFDMSRLKRYH